MRSTNLLSVAAPGLALVPPSADSVQLPIPRAKKFPFFPFHLKKGEEPHRKGVKPYTRGLNLASLDDFWGISELPEITHKMLCVCPYCISLGRGLPVVTVQRE